LPRMAGQIGVAPMSWAVTRRPAAPEEIAEAIVFLGDRPR
jgi:hypothetical protein